MVVIGNLPYSGHSENNSPWIKDLVNNYYFVDDLPLGEKNPKWLQDDYVKFMRFSQWRIDKSGKGILAFINNHGFLDNPTFRGMRQQLIKSFDAISIYDLHGNSKKKETGPGGGKDENVFDIQQGVSITLAIKGIDKYINHAHLYGSREDKYQVLSENTINTTNFTEVKPQKPFYLLIPQDNNLLAEYNLYFKITDIMPVNSVGIVTARDSLTIQDTPEDIWNVVNDFVSLDIEEARDKYSLGTDARDWKVNFAQNDIKDNSLSTDKIQPVLYRPFDARFTYYTGKSRGFICMPRGEVMKNMLLGKNLGLAIGRAGQVIDSNEWNIIFCAKDITEFNLYRRGGNNLFPLYLYPDSNKPKELQQEKRSNFSHDFLKQVENNLGELPTPEAIFYYIYAIFHSPTYRTRYAEFLKIDFPRVPMTSNKKLFTELSELGEQLVQLHLMTSPRLDKPITKFIKESDQMVATGHPKYDQGKVYINKTDYFQNVPEEVWNFHIGGYQVCQKWLKDRKGRTLSAEDITHYQKIIVALAETIKLMEKIDQTIPSFPIE